MLRGSDRFSFFIIGHTQRPEWFMMKTGEELGIQISRQSKGLNDIYNFIEWLRKFSIIISKTGRRKKVMFLEKSNRHSTTETMSMLYNVRVLNLLPSITSELQPMDAEIIGALKQM